MLEIINSWSQKKEKKKKTSFSLMCLSACVMKKDDFFFFFGLFQILLNEQEISRLDFIVLFLCKFFFFFFLYKYFFRYYLTIKCLNFHLQSGPVEPIGHLGHYLRPPIVLIYYIMLLSHLKKIKNKNKNHHIQVSSGSNLYTTFH